MSKISFYLIEKKPLRRVDLARRLCQQIHAKNRIWLYFQDQNLCDDWDLQFWENGSNAFLPHGIDQLNQPICLSLQKPNISFDICINLTEQVLNVSELANNDIHVIEIIENNEQDKQIARERFKQYRKMGIEPIIHRI